MAALTPTDAVLRVLENLGRVSGDAQLPSATIIRRLDDEYRTLRRRLSAEFPSIYEAVSTPTVVTSPTTTIAKPTDCETIRILEKQVGTFWVPLDVASSLNRDEYSDLSFYEIGANVQIVPDAAAPGIYRFVYLKKPADTVTTYDVPDGIERIIIEETSAWGRQRHNELEFVAYHKAEAKRIWDDNWMGLWNRYGSHGRSVLNQTRE